MANSISLITTSGLRDFLTVLPVGQPEGEELQARRLEQQVPVGLAEIADAGDSITEAPDDLDRRSQ